MEVLRHVRSRRHGRVSALGAHFAKRARVKHRVLFASLAMPRLAALLSCARVRAPRFRPGVRLRWRDAEY